MRRTTTLTAATLLGLALLAPTTAATAAAETCRGEAATIVGTTPTLTGTEGRDVIVTGSATTVSALGGDDLVCVTAGGTTKQLEIAAGYGSDVVDTTALDGTYSLNVTLGEGTDALIGGAAAETVTTGFLEFPEGVDSDTDTVRTGAGDDRVFVGAYPEYVGANTDVVDLGPGDDTAMWGSGFSAAPGASLTGGSGDDRLFFGLNGQGRTAAIDMAAGTVQVSGSSTTALGRFSSFESAEIAADVDGVRFPLVDVIDFRGTPGDDVLTVHHDRGGSSRMSIRTLGGDDRVLFQGVRLRPGSRIDGGGGDDLLVAAQDQGRLDLDLDLARGALRTRATWLGETVAATTRVSGLEDAVLMAPEGTLVGDSADNELHFNACRATVRGGHGDDVMRALRGDPFFHTYTFDCRARSTMSGGPGQDVMVGGEGRDKLYGDGGRRDRADGRGGRDRCLAEDERRCER